jgi:hypothetical protein
MRLPWQEALISLIFLFLKLRKLCMANTTNITNEIEFLENRIAKLDNDSFSMLRDWFIEFDQARWDKQLEADSNSGKLDFLINAALAEHQTGKTRDL